MLDQLHKAVSAIAPVDGVRIVNNAVVIDFKPAATAQQMSDAQALADSWDFSPAAEAQRQILALRQEASAALDAASDLNRAIDKAIVKEVLGYVNSKLTLLANTLQSKGVITVPERNNFNNGLATEQQAFNAIKVRLENGEGD